jgi:hypothetical protein
MMPLFGDAKVMALKIVWDFAYYWAVPASFFFHRRLTDLMAFAGARAALDHSGALNREIQQLFRAWHRSSGDIACTFIDIPAIPFMHALNRGLQDRLDEVQFRDRLQDNLALLDRLAGEILAFAKLDDPSLSLASLRPQQGSEQALLAGVLPRLSLRPGCRPAGTAAAP